MSPFTDRSRRRLIKKSAAGAAVVWAAPSVTTWDAVAAAAGSPISGITGQITLATLSPGESLLGSSNQYSSNQTGFLFAENCVTLPSSRTTDSGGTIPAGTPVQAYLFHFSRQGGTGSISGSFQLPGTIIGWDFTNGGLLNSDNPFAIGGVTYGSGRQFEANDTITVNTTTGQVTINSATISQFVDQARFYVLA